MYDSPQVRILLSLALLISILTGISSQSSLIPRNTLSCGSAITEECANISFIKTLQPWEYFLKRE
jgi:hypothetical protein